ncbi:MAG: hypothetical protein K9K76_01310 [Halanaerobiales bacterium]|nr:hypothetical protein [Halanaerobiales bacterium]
MLEEVKSILDLCDTKDSVIPPTELYNEGWLLRLVINWFSNNNASHELSFVDDEVRWYSELLLPSQFLARNRGDKLAESYTHADGVIGHFKIGNEGKGDILLNEDAKQFIVVEAKMSSKLSKGVTNASYFDQASRNVACIAEVLNRSDMNIDEIDELGFYVIAPKKQLNKKTNLKKYTDEDNVRNKVEKRVEEYKGESGIKKYDWYNNWFTPTLKKAKIECLSWEEVISVIKKNDNNYGEELNTFYDKCLKFNG